MEQRRTVNNGGVAMDPGQPLHDPVKRKPRRGSRESRFEEGDVARIRFMTSEPSWYEDDDRWRIVAFWELPEKDRSGLQGTAQDTRVIRSEDVAERYFRTRNWKAATSHWLARSRVHLIQGDSSAYPRCTLIRS